MKCRKAGVMMTMILSACLVVALVANLVAINRISEKIDQANDLITDLDMLYARVSKYLNDHI